jgi:HD-GYP domain-containing protein (c-di-GMP phosphodiesterase class II)
LSAIISLGHRSDSAWSEEDKRQAAQLADQVAVALSNARLVAELKQLHWGTLTALARAIDAKSHWTAGHSERVTSWAMKIARAMGLPEPEPRDYPSWWLTPRHWQNRNSGEHP